MADIQITPDSLKFLKSQFPALPKVKVAGTQPGKTQAIQGLLTLEQMAAEQGIDLRELAADIVKPAYTVSNARNSAMEAGLNLEAMDEALELAKASLGRSIERRTLEMARRIIGTATFVDAKNGVVTVDIGRDDSAETVRRKTLTVLDELEPKDPNKPTRHYRAD